MDSFLNVTFGIVLGGGLHALGGAVADAARARGAASEAGPEPLNAMRSVGPEAEPVPAIRPAELGARDIAVDQAGLRAGIADLAETGSVRNAEGAVRNEIEQLRNAYGEVRARPIGDAMDPAVTIAPGDIASAIVAHGGWKGLGDGTVNLTG